MKQHQKGLIALDIDGTITVDMKPIAEKVLTYFYKLQKEGWVFVFITGRTFEFGHQVLKALPFEYYYAPQNGAVLLEMPSKKIISKKYLDQSIISSLEKICEGEETDFVIYAGVGYENQCFYRPYHFSKDLLNYLKKRCKAFGETWTPIESFEHLALHEFASIKCFGKEAAARGIGDRIEKILGLHVPVIKDPFCNGYYVVQATHADVTKGIALSDLVKSLNLNGKIIAAGDDLNDLSMFEAADVCIAMEDAPQELKMKADFIAPCASNEGIIQGLERAIQSIAN